MVTLRLTASQEDYLEAIYAISAEKSVARVKDIAAHLGVHKSTVTAALHQLADRKLVNYTPYQAATLTAEGTRVGRRVLRRHETLTRFLVTVLDVDGETAAETACKMEHVIPADVIERFTRFVEFFEVCPHTDAKWDMDGRYSCGSSVSREECSLCREHKAKGLSRHSRRKTDA